MEELSATQEEMHRAQRRSEEALQEMKAKERDLYAMKSEFEAREAAVALTTLVTETDLHGNILYANDRFCEVSQFSRQEIVGRAHSVVRHPDMPSQLFEHCWTAIRKGNPFRAVFKNRKKSGEGFWVDCTIAAIKNENGDIVKYISTGHLIEDENIGLLLYNRRAESLEISQFETETI
jgi:PAS domain S-box-containing protein